MGTNLINITENVVKFLSRKKTTLSTGVKTQIVTTSTNVKEIKVESPLRVLEPKSRKYNVLLEEYYIIYNPKDLEFFKYASKIVNIELNPHKRNNVLHVIDAPELIDEFKDILKGLSFIMVRPTVFKSKKAYKKLINNCIVC